MELQQENSEYKIKKKQPNQNKQKKTRNYGGSFKDVHNFRINY